MGIEVRNISKKFGNYAALKDISMEVPDGELVSLLGPSGSGKTTLLRIIAGLEFPDAGSVLFNGEDATAKTARERKVGFVFQHYALFKHMTVFENVAFGLEVCPRRHRMPDRKIRAKVYDLLRLVQMEWLADRYPWQLSGGQRQRIALARALAVEPKVMLLDEPFGALDAKVRKELRRWIRRLHDEIHITSIFVTHDQDEALEVSDRVVIMNEGRIEQIGTPEEVYERPANLFVCKFLGSVNLFRGRLNEGRVQIGLNEYQIPGIEATGDLPALAYARPFELEVERSPNEVSNIKGIVSYVKAIGPIVRMELKLESGDLIEAELGKDRFYALAVKVGETLFVGLRNPKVFVGENLV